MYIKNQCPKYLFDIIPQSNCQYRTRNAHNIPKLRIPRSVPLKERLERCGVSFYVYGTQTGTPPQPCFER